MDRISNLPHEIRTHTLTFLPTEEAVKTSILSRQWREVASSLSTLNFDQFRFQRKEDRSKENFRDFLNQSLNLRRDSDVHKLKLSFIYDEEIVGCINEWISFAVSHNLCQLRLCSLRKRIENLHFPLFTCKTLTLLHLSNVNLISPTVINLPNLKVCAFCGVMFSEESLICGFFSNCPLLEELEIDRCSFNNHNVISISSPKLHLLILRTLPLDCEIKISSTVLCKIVSTGTLPDITFLNKSSPDIATFSIDAPSLATSSTTYHVTVQHAIKILTGLHNLTWLRLGGFYVEFLTREPNLLAHFPTSCPSLNCLKLDIFPTKNQVQAITFLLRIYPNLQILHLFVQTNSVFKNMLNTGGYLHSEDLSTDGILKKLKSVEIEFFKGSESEFDLVRYLLENARVMEEMYILFSKESQTDATIKTRTNEKIQTFTRASPNVTISLS